MHTQAMLTWIIVELSRRIMIERILVGLLTRALLDSILDAAPPLVLERVPCPEWADEGYVYVKMLTCAEAEVQERLALETGREVYGAMAKLGQMSEARAEALNLDETMTQAQARDILDDPASTRVPLLIATICNEEGVCLFTEDDAAALARQSPVLIRRLHDMAWKLNNTGPDAIEVAVKNFASRQSNDSGIAYQANGACPSDSANN